MEYEDLILGYFVDGNSVGDVDHHSVAAETELMDWGLPSQMIQILTSQRKAHLVVIVLVVGEKDVWPVGQQQETSVVDPEEVGGFVIYFHLMKTSVDPRESLPRLGGSVEGEVVGQR